MANNTIISTDTAEFAYNSLKSMYDMMEAGMSTKQKAPFLQALTELKDKAHRSREYGDHSYFQEQLQELDEDY